MVNFTLFDTPLGVCGVAWNEHGIVRSLLPDRSRSRIHQRLQAISPDGREVSTPPSHIVLAIIALTDFLAGKAVNLDDLVLDMRGVPEFRQAIYGLVRAIPRGQTLTYGEVATRVGQPGAARAVGQAMASNPFAPIVPCHRVLAAGNKPGGFTALGGALTKMKLLQMEDAVPGDLLGW